MKVNAVIFDMDGVIFDSENMARNSWLMVEKEFGVPVSREFMTKLLGMSHTGILDVYADYFGDYELGKRIYKWRLDYSAKDIEKNGIPVKPGVHEIFAFLKKSGIPMALASSSYLDKVERNFSVTGLEKPFKVIVTGDMLEHSKPDPEIFLRAARGVGVPPEECMVLEDSYNGINGAKAAGMIPVMVPDLVQPTPEIKAITYAICDSLLDVIPLIQQINQQN